MPLAARSPPPGSRRVAAGLAHRERASCWSRAGLAALALLPRAGWAWTIPPQLLVGAGLGLALAALTGAHSRGRASKVVHGGWTIASRHAGVVVGLLLLAPVLTDALERTRMRRGRAGTAAVLDSRVAAARQAAPRAGRAAEVTAESGELPDLDGGVRGAAGRRASYRDLRAALQDQLDRAVTAAFARPVPARRRARARGAPAGLLGRGEAL